MDQLDLRVLYYWPESSSLTYSREYRINEENISKYIYANGVKTVCWQ